MGGADRGAHAVLLPGCGHGARPSPDRPGADADSGLVHTLVGTAANVSDVSQTEHLLHGEEEVVFANAGYIWADKRVKWRIAMKRGKLKAMAEGPLKELTRRAERLKAQLRSRVEHPFHVIKNLFGHRKVRYRGLAKNTAQLHSLFALANLVIAKKVLLALSSQGASGIQEKAEKPPVSPPNPTRTVCEKRYRSIPIVSMANPRSNGRKTPIKLALP